MTIKDGFGHEVSSVLFRLNMLLENGYEVRTPKEVNDTVWLRHSFNHHLDLILFSDGLLVGGTNPGFTASTESDDPNKVRFYEEEHEKFLDFIKRLPKVNRFHNLLPYFWRVVLQRWFSTRD